VTLIKALNRELVDAEIAIYHPLFHFRPDVERVGTPLHILGTRGARDPLVLLRLIRLIRRGGFDVVHSYLRTPGVLARVATSFRRRPVTIVSERNVDIGLSRRNLLLERALANSGDAMIANAEAIRQTVVKHIPEWRDRIHVVPNGIDWSEPTPQDLRGASRFRESMLGGRDLLIGTIARVEIQKNPHLLLDAIELLPADVRDRVRFVWVGAWTDRALVGAVRERLNAGELKGCLQLLEPTDRIRSVYLALDGLVLSSSWEGCPNAVLEGLAHGRPVISTDVGDVSEIVRPGESGWIVPPEDAKPLSAAIVELVSLPASRRAEMGQAGSAFVLDKYSVERLAERTLSVYRHVLDPREVPVDRRNLD
jgi:glycosyltransferase involved in cell wall biosynthesis